MKIAEKHSSDCCRFFSLQSVSDIMTKTGMCGRKYVHYITSQTFFYSSLVKSESTWLHPEELKIIQSKKSASVAQTLTEPYEACKWNHLPIFSMLRSVCLNLGSPSTKHHQFQHTQSLSNHPTFPRAPPPVDPSPATHPYYLQGSK